MDGTEIFICYAHEDSEWKDEVLKFLRASQQKPVVWSDDRIRAGEDWFLAIEEAMSQAQVVIILISAESLGSDFIQREELPVLLERRANEGVKIYPLLLRECPWPTYPWFEGMQLRPKNREPLHGRRRHTIAKLLTDLVTEVVEALEEASGGPEMEAHSQHRPDPARTRSLKRDSLRASEAGKRDLRRLEREMQRNPRLAREILELSRKHAGKNPPSRPLDQPPEWEPPKAGDNKRGSRPC